MNDNKQAKEESVLDIAAEILEFSKKEPFMSCGEMINPYDNDNLEDWAKRLVAAWNRSQK